MLVGIARLAAESELLEAKRRVQYFELPSRSFFNRCTSPRVPFRWTINPYRGCEFACQYCYARYTHEFMELRAPEDFEELIFAKRWDEAAFRRDLARVRRADLIALGTATDPYQPSERRYEVTRKILRVFASESGRRLGITTKSDLILRDTDLLCQIARANSLRVSFTITTLDAAIARSLEPLAPRPELRLNAVARLASEGLSVGVFVAPILPSITDSETSLDALAAAAAACGATHFAGGGVFLRDRAKEVFSSWLEREYPHLASSFHRRFTRSGYLPAVYKQALDEKLATVRGRHGLASRPPECRPEPWPEEGQGRLFAL